MLGVGEIGQVDHIRFVRSELSSMRRRHWDRGQKQRYRQPHTGRNNDNPPRPSHHGCCYNTSVQFEFDSTGVSNGFGTTPRNETNPTRQQKSRLPLTHDSHTWESGKTTHSIDEVCERTQHALPLTHSSVTQSGGRDRRDEAGR